MRKNNAYFIVSGVLSIVAAIGYAYIALLCFILGVFAGAFESGSEAEGVSLYSSTAFLVYMILALVVCVVSIFLAVVFLKNRKKTHDELRQKNGLIITAIVLSFILGGILIGVIALMGYLNTDEGVNVETVGTSDGVEEKLRNLKEMLDRGEISQEEYDEMRKKILDDF